jgi:hypothetical protein
LREVSLWDLLEAFGRLLDATGGLRTYDITYHYDDTPQHVVIERVLVKLTGTATEPPKERLTLRDLLGEKPTKGVIISILLAVLELVKRGVLRAMQEKTFGEIFLLRGPIAPQDVKVTAEELDPNLKPVGESVAVTESLAQVPATAPDSSPVAGPGDPPAVPGLSPDPNQSGPPHESPAPAVLPPQPG